MNASFAFFDGGTLLLSGNNTYSGTTTITGGVIAVTANDALGTTAGGTTVNGGAGHAEAE